MIKESHSNLMLKVTDTSAAMRGNQSLGPLTRSDTNRHVQSQEMASSLKFWFSGEEEWYCLCSENKCCSVTAQLICVIVFA